MFNETRGKIHFWWSLIAFSVTFFPMHFLGLAGMPRRDADYPMQFAADFNAVASVGAFAFGLAPVYFFVFIVLPTMLGKGEKAAQKPWEAAGRSWSGKSPRRRPSTPSRPRPAWTPPRPGWSADSALGVHDPRAEEGQPRTGLILASVALVFFLGFMARMIWLGR
jgi:heme/copper-type cytochrome/quinol oxidase subunit 1